MDGSGKKLDISGRDARPFVHSRAPRGLSLAAAPSSALVLSAEAVSSHFTVRRWTLRSESARAHHHLLALTGGVAAVGGEERATADVRAPALAWLPAGCAEYLDLAAGASAQLLRMRADAWHRYLPPSAEPAYLELAGASGILAFPVELDQALTASRSVAAIAAELANPARSAASSIIASELTLIVLRFRRHIASDADGDAERGTAEILTRFRRLVDERYPQHLRVAEYAALLGMTADRLHSLCSRAVQRSPSALIQQRIVQEGIARLESSTATVKQIAFALGFKDTAYFSRFFRKHTGKPPGVWRREAGASGLRKRTARSALNFADWP